MRGDAGKRRYIACRIGSAIGRGKHQRRALARTGDRAGIVGADGRDRPRPLEATRRLAQGLHHVPSGGAAQGLLHEVSDDLGVRLAPELVPTGLELLAKRTVVLDDAVVDDGHTAIAARVRVGVSVGGGTVGGPARVGDAAGGAQVPGLALLDQRRDAASALHAGEAPVLGQHLNARGVVAAVLERLEPVEEKGDGLGRAGVGNDSAHGRLPSWSAATRPHVRPQYAATPAELVSGASTAGYGIVPAPCVRAGRYAAPVRGTTHPPPFGHGSAGPVTYVAGRLRHDGRRPRLRAPGAIPPRSPPTCPPAR